MSALIKSGVVNPRIQSSCFRLRSAFFHSTPVLERGRRNYWNSRYTNNNNGRSRRNPSRHHILKNINEYAEYLIQNWQRGFDPDEDLSNKGSSGFRQPHNRSGRNWTNNQGRQSRRRRGFSFCEEDDDDIDDAFFRSAFGDRFFFWSFVHEDYPNWRASSRNSNWKRTSWKRRQQSEDEYDYASEDDSPKPNLASERVALGLSASGPLKVKDVKNAYRACALKWHPDRHLGSSKAAAEEKFKLCTAAYQSLCDRLAVN